jgi:hypothetical protein
MSPSAQQKLLKGKSKCILLLKICTCVIHSPEPCVTANLAVALTVVDLPTLEVVEQLARPAAPGANPNHIISNII